MTRRATIERRIDARAAPPVALETTLLIHGVPRAAALPLFEKLRTIITDAGAQPALVGLVNGTPTVGMTTDELSAMLDHAHDGPGVQKANTANLGLLQHKRQHGATTVSATMHIAARAGIRVFATGGIGGVHTNYGAHLDISADLTALSSIPIAVVASGVKSILDVAATREALETLGVPVIGFQTNEFPAFYLRSIDGVAPCDGRFDDAAGLAAFCQTELMRRNSAVLVANPIPTAHELDAATFHNWLTKAEERAKATNATGRDTTPAILAALHELSEGQTLDANIALVEHNARVAASVAAAMTPPRSSA